MTLVAIESFDTFGTTNGVAGAANVVAGMGRKYTGEFAVGDDVHVYDGWGVGKAYAHGSDFDADNNYVFIPVGTPKDEIIVGFAYKPKTIPYAALNIVSFYDVAEDIHHVQLVCLYNNSLRVMLGISGTVALGTVYNCFRPNRWVYLEARALIDDTVGEVEVKINGIQVLNLTNQDTNNSAVTPQISHVVLRGSRGDSDDSADVNLYDDLYIVNTEGASNNTFLGPHKVEALYPDAEGDIINFTPSAGTDNALNVDENPADDDTTYNESSTTGHYDLLTASNLSTITGNIKGVQLNTDARIVNASPVDLYNKVKSSTTEDDAAAQQVSDTVNYTTFYDVWEEDPATTAAWLLSAVNGIQIGYELG